MGGMPDGRPSSNRRARPETGRPVLSARAGAALGVLVILIAILAIPFKEWITQRARISDLESQLAWHTQRAEELRASLARWDDPAYVEAQARARLHFVHPGEVGYVVLDDQASAQETTPTRPMVQAPSGGPWWSAVWSTVEQADAPDEGSRSPLAPAPAEPAQTYGQ
jgi:cell division protein FtsB